MFEDVQLNAYWLRGGKHEIKSQQKVAMMTSYYKEEFKWLLIVALHQLFAKCAFPHDRDPSLFLY